jgi:hypothetical protein
MNSLRDGTGNQFGHNRESNFRQQGIKSATTGKWQKKRFARRAERLFRAVAPSERVKDG